MSYGGLGFQQAFNRTAYLSLGTVSMGSLGEPMSRTRHVDLLSLSHPPINYFSPSPRDAPPPPPSGAPGRKVKRRCEPSRSYNLVPLGGAVGGERSLSAFQLKGKSKKKSAGLTSSGFKLMSDSVAACEISSVMADEDMEFSPTLSTSLHSPQSAAGSSTLSQLVALQSAEGFWTLDQSLASLIGCTLVELKGACPAGCTEVMWATLLALSFLEKQFTSHHDEWELVAMKAEFWLQSQPLPSTVDSLKQIASQNLDTEL